VKENNKYRKAAVSGNITMESTISLWYLWNSNHSLKGLGMVSNNIGPVCSQKLKFRHLQIFWLQSFVEYPQCIEMTFFFKNAHVCYKYRIQNRSYYLYFPKIHWISYVLIIKSIKMNLATLL
jgi:hypothetical protein